MGNLHGGTIASLIDVYTTLPLLFGEQKLTGVSVDLAITYQNAINCVEHPNIVVVAEVEKHGNAISFLTAKVLSEGSGLLSKKSQATTGTNSQIYSD